MVYTSLGGYGIPAIPTHPNYCRLCGYSKDAIPSYCYSLYILYIIKYVVIFIFIYELLSIGGLGKSKTKRAESPMLSIAQGNALGKRIQTINAPCFTLTEQVFRAKDGVNYI